tara:strand:- start:202 stop:606 length:405 start_codon:yes stop_codon:yes gene_type:complete
MKIALYKADTVGAIASTLCVIHCLATPFIFVVQSCTAACCANAPGWWASFDYIFLLISFVSIYRSTQTTIKKIMKPILWSNFFLLFALIINEKIKLIFIAETATYVTALTLAIMHLYNLKYCQCKSDKCCAQNG